MRKLREGEVAREDAGPSKWEVKDGKLIVYETVDIPAAGIWAILAALRKEASR